MVSSGTKLKSAMSDMGQHRFQVHSLRQALGYSATPPPADFGDVTVRKMLSVLPEHGCAGLWYSVDH